MLFSVLAVVIAYCVGSLSFAVIVSKLAGLADPRGYGSGNPGATNVLRSGNKGAALATLLLDAAKGALPVFLAQRLSEHFERGDVASVTVACVGLAAFIGHLAPVFFGFKGGKGVATALGVLVGLQPLLGLATVLTWLIVAFFFRYSSLAALIAAFFAPAYYLFGNGVAWQAHRAFFVVMVVMALALAWRHRANIRRLWDGSEPRIGAAKPTQTTQPPA